MVILKFYLSIKNILKKTSFSGIIYYFLSIGMSVSFEEVIYGPKSSNNLCKGTGLCKNLM